MEQLASIANAICNATSDAGLPAAITAIGAAAACKRTAETMTHRTLATNPEIDARLLNQPGCRCAAAGVPLARTLTHAIIRTADELLVSLCIPNRPCTYYQNPFRQRSV
jgi:hypothetical protein